MPFKVGDAAVHPQHGAAIVEGIETREVRGEEQEYLVLRILAQDGLVVRVPSDNLEMVGVRDVMGDDGLEKLLGVLQELDVEEPSNWSRRFKANTEKLNSGDVFRVAEIVRDLTRRQNKRGLSAGEKSLLTQARQIIISELALARDTDEEGATELLDSVLIDPPEEEKKSAKKKTTKKAK